MHFSHVHSTSFGGGDAFAEACMEPQGRLATTLTPEDVRKARLALDRAIHNEELGHRDIGYLIAIGLDSNFSENAGAVLVFARNFLRQEPRFGL